MQLPPICHPTPHPTPTITIIGICTSAMHKCMAPAKSKNQLYIYIHVCEAGISEMQLWWRFWLPFPFGVVYIEIQTSLAGLRDSHVTIAMQPLGGQRGYDVCHGTYICKGRRRGGRRGGQGRGRGGVYLFVNSVAGQVGSPLIDLVDQGRKYEANIYIYADLGGLVVGDIYIYIQTLRCSWYMFICTMSRSVACHRVRTGHRVSQRGRS